MQFIKNNTSWLSPSYLFLLSGALSALNYPVFASMTVYPMQTEVGTHGTSQITVQSNSTEVQYIKVSVKQIVNPATHEEKEIPVTQFTEDALLVTPQKMILTAGSERIVRLVMLKPLPRETTWRVYFESVPENAFTDMTPATKGIGLAQVGVNIIWGALVHVAPEKAHVALHYIPASGQIDNNGTVRIPLSEIAECSADERCQWKKETTTIYPGTRLTLSTVKFDPARKYKIKYHNWMTNTAEEKELPAVAGY